MQEDPMCNSPSRSSPVRQVILRLLAGLALAGCADDPPAEDPGNPQLDAGDVTLELGPLPEVVEAPRGSGVALTAGGGLLESDSYRLAVTVGDHSPVAVRQSTQYRLHLGLATQVLPQ
jgi:hypothetical protein